MQSGHRRLSPCFFPHKVTDELQHVRKPSDGARHELERLPFDGLARRLESHPQSAPHLSIVDKSDMLQTRTAQEGDPLIGDKTRHIGWKTAITSATL